MPKPKKPAARLPRRPQVLKAHRSGAGAHRSPFDYRRADNRKAVREQTPERAEGNGGLMYHLAPEPHYLRFGPGEPYISERYYEEGFIHFTGPEAELMAAGNRYYRDDPRPYLVLTVDRTLVTAPVKYEDLRKIFPHLHGPLNRNAIVEVRVAERTPEGTFIGPGETYDGE